MHLYSLPPSHSHSRTTSRLLDREAWCGPDRLYRVIPIVGIALIAFVALLEYSSHLTSRHREQSSPSTHHSPDTSDGLASPSPNGKLHILLPASNKGVDLCKTILTGTILSYSMPTLIAWNETFNQGGLLGGGSHIAKIEGVLEYLEGMDSSADDDLVMMMDAYDIWLQLRPEVLIARYHAINAAANERLASRLGDAVHAEGLRQTIIFGAGKRCAPNELHTVACYPIPDSPLPEDLYGGNTDTPMGRTRWSSLRQRYLNSGYAIGPVADMRQLFRRAQEKVRSGGDAEEWDDGSHKSDRIYHGSDQSVFNTILGEQEFQREVMRRRHSPNNSKSKPIHIEGVLIEDILQPDFSHQPIEHKSGKPDEFGMGLDYFSELGQQTINTEADFRFLDFGKPISEQLKDRHGLFDCLNRANGNLPSDILDSRAPLADINGELSWNKTSLLTNLCLNTIPVMIHHNGWKDGRTELWDKTWMQPHARELMAEIQSRRRDGTIPGELGGARGGALLPDGQQLEWGELCTAEDERELFRDS